MMEGVIEGDFISQFHNIQGDLISERKKNLFKLLRNTSVPVNDEVIKNLSPKTHLESLFKIDVLIYHKKTTELMNIFKEGNEVFVSKILKQPWIFQEMLKNMRPNEIVNDFFPCLSYSIRMKMLKKVAITFKDYQMDEIFDCLYERYGLFFATKILHHCTIKKIKEVLASYEIELTPKQIKSVFDKDQDLFVEYLDYFRKLKKNYYTPKYLVKYIALNNPKLWIELLEKNKITCYATGRRNSKKIIKLMRDDIIQDVYKYSSFLNKAAIVGEFYENFDDIYYKLFPKNIREMNMYNFCNELMKFYPKKKRWPLFVNTFSKVFEKNVLDNLNCLDTSFVRLFPEKTITQKWALVKYKSTSDDSLLKFCDPNEAIPLIKQKINVTSDIYKRKELVFLLLENCAENTNLTSLTSVLKYICHRHRNEDINFHNNILSKISNLFVLKDFCESHWGPINEEITILKARQEFNFFTHNRLLERYLEYLFVNKKPYINEIEEYVTNIIERFHRNLQFRIKLDNPPIEKEILKETINIFPKVVPTDHLHFNTLKINLINDLVNFNREHPQYSINISDFPSLIAHINLITDRTNSDNDECYLLKNIILYGMKFPKLRLIEDSKITKIFTNNKTNQYWFEEIWKKLILKSGRSKLENKLVHVYFNDILEHWPCDRIILWFIHNEPRTIIPYFDKILETSIQYQRIVNCSDIKLLSHLNLDTKMIDFYIKKLRPDEDQVGFIIHRLLQLLTTEDFIKMVVTPYLPVKIKLDTRNEEMVKNYNLQCKIAEYLKYCNEPAKMLPIVMKFSVGDYLQSSLQSLYSIFYRSPENLLYYYIDSLSQRAVSARKHSLFLSCDLLNFNYVINMMKTIKEENISSQKYICSRTLKYFVKNQTEELFNIVIKNLGRIDENDEETLGELTNISVPKKYLPLYIEKCWHFYESMRKKEIDIKQYLDSFLIWLSTTDNLILLLSRDFCLHIINNYFKEQKNEILFDTETFVCAFLKHRKTEREKNFKYILEILSNLKSDKRLKEIYKFYDVSYRYASDDRDDFDFFQRFSHVWCTLFTPKEKFNYYILLQLLSLQYKSKKENYYENYAQGVVTFLETLTLQYGQLVYEQFKTNLSKTLSFPIKDRYIFLRKILECKISTFTCMLVFDLITPPSSDEREDTVIIYKEILETLRNVNDPLVQIYVENYSS